MTTPTPDSYRYKITLYDRILVNGELRLTHYHVYVPINPAPHQSNAFVPVARETDAGDWADAQDCYGNKLNTPPVADPQREIKYDRETKDYALYLDGECVGYARSYAEGEQVLDQLVFERLSAQKQAA